MQSVEVPVARGRKEGLDDLSLSVQVGVGNGALSPHDVGSGRLAATTDPDGNVLGLLQDR